MPEMLRLIRVRSLLVVRPGAPFVATIVPSSGAAQERLPGFRCHPLRRLRCSDELAREKKTVVSGAFPTMPSSVDCRYLRLYSMRK